MGRAITRGRVDLLGVLAAPTALMLWVKHGYILVDWLGRLPNMAPPAYKQCWWTDVTVNCQSGLV